MATFGHRSDILIRTRQAATALLAATADLEACAAAWNRGISGQVVDASGSDPNAAGYQANDFRGNEGLVKADINKVLTTALESLRSLLLTADGKKFEDIAS